MRTQVNNASLTRRYTRGKCFGAATPALIAALFCWLVPAQPAHAQNNKEEKESNVEEGLYSCGKAKGPVSVSFKPDVELKDLITWAMGFTCKNFVYDSGVGNRSKKVTIIAPKKMTPQQAWRVFLVAIQTMGLTVVPHGNVLRISELAQAKQQALPLYRKGTPGATSQLVRVVIRPQHLPVEDLNQALGALKSKEGQVTALPKVGVVVVTDYGSNISKMRQFLTEVDQPIVGERLYMVKVSNADATEMVAKLNEILGTSSTAPQTSSSRSSSSKKKRSKKSDRSQTSSKREIEVAVPSKMIADERTNAIIVLASEPAYLRVRSLVKRLDVAVGVEGDGRIYVHYLENADAEEMANTLSAVITGVSQPSSRGRAGRNQPARRPAAAPAGASSPAFEGQVRVSHDKPTNSLVVIASVKDYFALKNVIERLDKPRRQVFIEAIILEVSADNSRDLGTSFHGGSVVDGVDDGAIAIGGLQHGGLSSINPASLAGLQGLIGGILGPLLDESAELLGTSIPSFGVLFQALANTSNINVLSSPHLLTTDNEEAEISVGQNIPFQSGFSSFGGAAGGAAGGFGIPVQSVQRQDVALTLKITPHVNESDMVRLIIDQEISDIASPNFEGLGPAWSKRTIKTTVVVRDQQTIVIGGLMSDRTTYSESKIPLLGDIPLLGYLFKYSQSGKLKTNLLVLLTPYVIKDQMDIEQIVERKVRERNEFVRTFSNFARMELDGNVDYRRKRGLVEEINRKVIMIEREAEELRAASSRGEDFPDGLIEYDDLDSSQPSAPSGDGTGPSSDSGAQPSAPATQPGASPSAATSGNPAAAKTAQKAAQKRE